jgi:hypothetical protein
MYITAFGPISIAVKAVVTEVVAIRKSTVVRMRGVPGIDGWIRGAHILGQELSVRAVVCPFQALITEACEHQDKKS